jgi:uracil-DNA glycosylase
LQYLEDRHPELVRLARQVFADAGGPGLHNPHDVEHHGAFRRRANLLSHLNWATQRGAPDAILVGEAHGPWGARYSGIPFTGEAQFLDGSLGFSGYTTSETGPHREQSGSIVWGTVNELGIRPLLWNTVMLHPHHVDDPDSIRKPTLREIQPRLHVLKALAGMFPAARVVAIGQTARDALQRASVPHEAVRHPARGGAPEFRQGLRRLFHQVFA